jgi:hypothetical protein
MKNQQGKKGLCDDMTKEEAVATLGYLRVTLCNKNEVMHHFSPKRVEALDLAIEALRDEPAAAQRYQLLKEVDDLRAELATEREKVEKLKLWTQYECVGYLVRKKIHDLWPDPEPAPEPKMWDWAIEELKAGRKVRWYAWTDKKKSLFLLENDTIQLKSKHGSEGRFKPSLCHFTEPGWLPYEENNAD